MTSLILYEQWFIEIMFETNPSPRRQNTYQFHFNQRYKTQLVELDSLQTSGIWIIFIAYNIIDILRSIFFVTFLIFAIINSYILCTILYYAQC